MIVILGCARRQGALESSQNNQQQDVSSASIERLRFGTRLVKLSQLPVLVTCGVPDKTSDKDLSEVQLISRVLQRVLNVSVKWVDGGSSAIQENKKLSAQILKNSFNVIEAPMG